MPPHRRRFQPPAREVPYDPKKMDFLGNLSNTNTFGKHYGEVVRAVENLPEPYRTIIERLFWERVPLRELAKELDKDHKTISYHRDRALELLKEELKDASGD